MFADYWSARPAGSEAQATFVGREACVECHRKEAEAFAGSHHDLAMDLATDETVLGDFNDVDASSTMESPAGCIATAIDSWCIPKDQREDGGLPRQVRLRCEPLQQYMVEFDRTDDICRKRNRPRSGACGSAGTPNRSGGSIYGHPTSTRNWSRTTRCTGPGIAQRWQTMCAECHSTNLKRNFDPQIGTIPHHIFGNRCQLRSLSRSRQSARRTCQQSVVILGPQSWLRAGAN